MWSNTVDAVRVEGLGKRYLMGRPYVMYRTLRESVSDWAAGLGRTLGASRGAEATPVDHLWALRDVTLSVPHGQAVGIIGCNGSGKSTFLKVLSRVTEPTTGFAEIRGRVGSLLELGTGFHQELTGRENVFLSGAILGMRRAEIQRRFDEIIEFAEISRFVDLPVKRYSSGMSLRLAFSVAAHLETQVLLVDEVLAVGDAAFQRKCLGRMGDVTGQGRTVVFVSHNLDAIQRLCPTCVLLDQGQVIAHGPASSVIERYLSQVRGDDAPPLTWIDLAQRHRRHPESARFVAVRYTSFDESVGHRAYPDGPLELTLEIEADSARSVKSMWVAFDTITGARLIKADIVSIGATLCLRPGRNTVRFRIAALHLNPGVYAVGLWLGHTVGASLDHLRAAFQIEVVPRAGDGLAHTPDAAGLVPCRFEVTQEA